MPGGLKEAVKAFIDCYSWRRYHERLSGVTPYDVCAGIRREILQRGKEGKDRTLRATEDYDRTVREQGPHGL